MFRKIFLSFWLTVISVGCLAELLIWHLHNGEQRAIAQARTLQAAARPIADAWERADAEGVSKAVAELQRRTAGTVNVLDSRGVSILNQPLVSTDREAVAGAARFFALGLAGSFVNSRRGTVAQQFNASSGHRFTVIVHPPRRTEGGLALLAVSPQAILAAILVLGGIVCFLLARHFTSPLVRLGITANAVADGRLNTRAGEDLGRRRDEIGALARDFDRMVQRIEALVVAERRVLGDVSHELRSPLARLRVSIGLARQRPPELAECLTRIERETERLDQIIGQLLTLSRIDSGVDAELSGCFDLAELVQEIVSDGDFEARAHGRRVDLGAADACIVCGAAEQMRGAVENVVRNAIRHTQAGTAVEVSLRTVEAGGVSSASLSIRDHGSGVSDEWIGAIFKPFWRAPLEQPGSHGGAGLGLAIAERVVTMHGGRIGAMNAEGGGLIVTIDLPLAGSEGSAGAS